MFNIQAGICEMTGIAFDLLTEILELVVFEIQFLFQSADLALLLGNIQVELIILPGCFIVFGLGHFKCFIRFGQLG